MSNRRLKKCMRVEVDHGFWNPEVRGPDGEIITPRKLVHPRIPDGDLIDEQVTPVNMIYIHRGGPNVVWPISPLAQSYRDEP